MLLFKMATLYNDAGLQTTRTIYKVTSKAIFVKVFFSLSKFLREVYQIAFRR